MKYPLDADEREENMIHNYYDYFVTFWVNEMFALFFLLVSEISCEIISVTRENINSTIRSKTDHPYFVWFWSPYCSHCSQFRPEWKKLTNESIYKSNVHFADVNCVQYTDICKQYSINGYPTLTYIIPSPYTRVDFLGAHKFEAIEQFLEKQVQFPALSLQNQKEIKNYINLTNSSSLFLLTYNSSSKNLLLPYKEIAQKFRETTARFFTYSSEESNSLIVYREKDDFIEFKEDFSYESMLSFVQKNLNPYLPPLSNEIFDDSKINGTFLLIFVVNNEKEYQKATKTVKDLPDDPFKYAYLNDPSNFIVKFMGIRKKMIPCIAMLNAKKNQWRFYPKKQSFDTLKENKNNLIEWSNEALNSSLKLKWKGPGDGLFSTFLVQVYSIKAQGGIILAILLFLLSIVVLLISLIFLDMFGLLRCSFCHTFDKYE